MQMLLEFLPIAAFVITYKFFGGIYVATKVLMVAMPLSLAILWLRDRKMPTMYTISTLLVLAFGAATLLLRNPRFLQWKPTVLYWVGAVAFLLSAFIGQKPLAQRFLQHLVGDAEMTRGEWQKLNAAWVVFCVVTGAANLVVAFNAPESLWVDFKLWGLMGMSILFMAGQMYWLHARGKLKLE